MKRLFYTLTGGRPMRDEGASFRDVVSGEMVRRYTDGLGRKWLATGPWSMFRVERASAPIQPTREG